MPEFVRASSAFIARANRVLLPQAAPFVSNDKSIKPAAVLVPIVKRAQGLTVLLTKRSDEMPSHAGQVAFPGGKIDQGDRSPLDAALREMEEETGIERRFANLVGYLDTFETGSGFSIVPAVAMLETGFELIPEPGEVSDIFEVPLPFLMDRKNHQSREAEWRGATRQFFEMPYKHYYIWGITAMMIRELSNRLHGYD